MPFLDPKNQAEVDQSVTFLMEYIPRVCYGMYQNFIKEGFTESQAIQLCGDYIRSISPTNAK